MKSKRKLILEVKGIINQGAMSTSLTCCTDVPSIILKDPIKPMSIDLYTTLRGRFGEETTSDGDSDSYEVEDGYALSLEYLILDTPPPKNTKMEEFFERTVLTSIYASHPGTCYSTWTCGEGNFDYFIGGDRSIFNELALHLGKWLYLRIYGN